MPDVEQPQLLWDHELTAIHQNPADWLWDGFVARGNLTLLTSQWKAGKTTLLSMLLSRRKTGGNLANLAVQPGKSVIVSEESTALWADRARRFDFGGHVCIFPQPFETIPSAEQWQALLDRILALKEQHGLDFAVIDPLAPFCRGENQAVTVLETLLPLSALTRRGMAVMVLHHPAKGERPLGQAARGSGALLGHVDVSMEMRHPAGDPLTRRRRFVALSRHAATPRNLMLELNADGTDYVVLPEAELDDFQTNWQLVQMVLEEAPQKFTRRDILDEWPPDFQKPERTTLWRWLDRAVKLSLVACEGKGNKSDPFRYWLPEREEVWLENPRYKITEEHNRMLNLPFVSWRERKKKLGIK